MTLPASEPSTVLTGLSAVAEFALAADGESVRTLWAVALRFNEGVLLVEALPEQDECAMRLLAEPTLQHWDDADGAWSDLSKALPWSRFIGEGVSLWRWRLTNQSGYTDGAQVHLIARGDPDDEVEVQWMVEASRLRGSVLQPLPASG